MRDGGAAAAERPDGVLPEAGAARGQRVRGGAAQGEETVQYSLLDTIGITGRGKPALSLLQSNSVSEYCLVCQLYFLAKFSFYICQQFCRHSRKNMD